jgi:AcrR family transcriptional regulator
MRSDGHGADLTARAQIRNAALRLFADHGPDAVSVRQIAATAGVSPALVLHHFGSKAGLREAVDQYAAAQFDALFEDAEEVGEILSAGSSASMAELFARAFPEGSPLPAYLRRLVLDGDPAGRALFRGWYAATLVLLERLTAAGFARPSEDPEVRAAFMLAADLVLVVLREPLTDVLGIDPLSPAGLPRWAAEVARIYRDGAIEAPPASTDERGRGE